MLVQRGTNAALLISSSMLSRSTSTDPHIIMAPAQADHKATAADWAFYVEHELTIRRKAGSAQKSSLFFGAATL